MDESDLLPTIVEDIPAPKRKAGNVKRKKANALPRAFFIYDGELKQLLGAVSLISANNAVGKHAWCECGIVATLSEPYRLKSEDLAYASNVFKLTTSCEQMLRGRACTTGNTLNGHLSTFATKLWSVLTVSSSSSKLIFHSSRSVPRFDVELAVIRQAGISPSDSDADINNEIEKEAKECFDEGCDLPRVQASASNLSGTIETMRQCLMNARTGDPSSKKIRYSADTMLSCLKLKSQLRPQATIPDVLADALTLLLPDSSQRTLLQDDLRSEVYQLPGYLALNHAQVKLDICNILFEQKLSDELQYLRYWMIDSSPQLGWDFLCIIEHRIRLPIGDFSATYWVNFDLNSGLEIRYMPLSTIALGNAGAVKKASFVRNAGTRCHTTYVRARARPVG